MAAPRRGPLLQTVWVLHRFAYRLTGERRRVMGAANSGYAEYEARTSRPIPVVLLERA